MTVMVNVAMHGARFAADIVVGAAWCDAQMPSGCASAVTVYRPGELGAVYTTLRPSLGSAKLPPPVPTSLQRKSTALVPPVAMLLSSSPCMPYRLTPSLTVSPDRMVSSRTSGLMESSSGRLARTVALADATGLVNAPAIMRISNWYDAPDSKLVMKRCCCASLAPSCITVTQSDQSVVPVARWRYW